MRPCGQSVRNIFRQPAGLQRAGCSQLGEHPAAVDSRPEIALRTEPRLVEGAVDRRQPQVQLFRNRQALRIDRVDEPAHARCHALLVEVEVPARALDAPGVQKHARRMDDRVHRREAGRQHVGVEARAGKPRLEQRPDTLGLVAGERAGSEAADDAPDVRRGWRELAADVRCGVCLGHDHVRWSVALPQDPEELQPPQGPRHQHEYLAGADVRSASLGEGFVPVCGDDEQHKVVLR